MKTRSVSTDELISIIAKKRVLAGVALSAVISLAVSAFIVNDVFFAPYGADLYSIPSSSGTPGAVLCLGQSVVVSIIVCLIFVIFAISTSATGATENEVTNRAMIAAILGAVTGGLLGLISNIFCLGVIA